MEAAASIHRLEAALGDRAVCVVLLVGDEEVVLVDSAIAGVPRDLVVPYLASIGLEPEQIGYVISSHADFDHIGGNAELRDLAPSALILCHEADRPQIEDVETLIDERYREFTGEHGLPEDAEGNDWIRSVTKTSPVDRSVSDGERIKLGRDRQVEVLHTPGHSAGHLTLYDAATRTAVISDAVLWNALLTTSGTPAFPPTYRHVAAYRRTIERLAALPIETLLTGHFSVRTGADVQEFLAESAAFCDRFEHALERVLRGPSTPQTTPQLIEILSPELGSWPDSAAPVLAFPLVGHLEDLEAAGSVRRDRDGELTTWRWEEG